MRLEKQVLFLQYLISNGEILANCANMIEPSYFDPELRIAIAFTKQYYEEFDTTPPLDIINAETGLKFEKVDLKKDQMEYAVNELAAFCRRRAIEQFAIKTATAVQNNEQFDVEQALEQALSVGLSPDVGDNIYDDVYDRISNSDDDLQYYSTGWPSLDVLLGGGYARTTATLFMGNSGTGKSIHLANAARYLALQKLNVVFITLELSKKMTEDRFNQIITNKDIVQLKRDLAHSAAVIEVEGQKSGMIHIQKMSMSGTTPNDIKQYIKEYHTIYGAYPDALVLDYIDLLSPNGGDTQSVFNDDKRKSEQLKSIIDSHNMILVTASQQNRTGVGVIDTNQSHISGGISKINTVDNAISIIRSSTLKAEDSVVLKLVKVRSGIGTDEMVKLKWPKGSLRITDPGNVNNTITTNDKFKDEWKNDEYDDYNVLEELKNFVDSG